MKPIDFLLAIVANGVWAFNFIACKAGVEHFPPFMFNTLRFSLLTLLLLPFLRWCSGQMGRVLLVALIMGGLHFNLFAMAFSLSSDVSSLAIINQLYVPISAILAIMFLGEPLQYRVMSGVFVSFLGVLILGFDPVVFNHLPALACMVGVALSLATSAVLIRGLQNVPVFTLQAWIAVVGVPIMALLSGLFEHDQKQLLVSATLLQWAAPAYAAIAASLVGHGIVYYLLKRYPVTITTPLMLLSPVMAVGFGVWIWGDQLNIKLVIGGILVLMGVVVISIPWHQMRLRRRHGGIME